MEVYPIDKITELHFKEVSRRIFRLQNGRSLDSMERMGADIRGQIGASYLSLKNLASEYQADLNLATLLWGTGKREEQVVACFLLPAERLNTEKITQLLLYCYSFEVAEDFGTLVLSKRKDIEKRADEYLNSGQPFLQTAALTAIGRNRIDRKLNSVFSDSYLHKMDPGIFKEPHVLAVYKRISVFPERRNE